MTKGSPITNADLISKLLQKAQEVSQMAVIHCQGHRGPSSDTALGNEEADWQAKGAAATETPECQLLAIPSVISQHTTKEIQSLPQGGWWCGKGHGSQLEEG